jgi:uncharacterized alkaline shock family protein YloU/adenylate kinase family enzyme
MKIYALVGRSGTGKSYKAQSVAGMYDIEYILDDGLLIKGTKIIAGISAKREDTRIAAVRRAIFVDESHRESVKKAIEEHRPEKILIIGTSENMIMNIMSALKLGTEYTLIEIEDVSSPEEIEAANRARRGFGKHVIPVPTFEIKKDFSGYFLDSIKQLVKKDDNEFEVYEKTIVRPTFSYLGKYEIKDGALKSIVTASALEVENVNKVSNIEIKSYRTGIIINVGTVFRLREPLHKIGGKLAKKVKENVEYMTGINVLEVNVSVRAIKVDLR